MTSLIIFKVILALFAQNSYVQAQPINSDEKFAAIVQYTQGKPSADESKKQTTLDFKDFISFGKTIYVPHGSRLKIITQKRCVAVFYDDTEVQSPQDRESPWAIKKGSARWICPEDKIERINYSGVEIDIKNGELLLENDNLIVFRDHVSVKQNPLKTNIVYELKDKKISEKQHQPNKTELWKTDQSYAIPIESSRLRVHEPEIKKEYNPMVNRIFIEGMPLGYGGAYQSYWEKKASDFKMRVNGVRLGTNFPWKNKSVLLFFDETNTESSDNHKNTMGAPVPTGFKSLSADEFTLGIGLRHDHISSGSTYYYLGLSRIKYNFAIQPSLNENYHGELEYNLAASAGFGYQKIFWKDNWISLVVGAEGKITQSLTKGDLKHYDEFAPSSVDPRGYLTTYNVVVYFGPEFNF